MFVTSVFSSLENVFAVVCVIQSNVCVDEERRVVERGIVGSRSEENNELNCLDCTRVLTSH